MSDTTSNEQLFTFPAEGAVIGVFDNEVFLQEALPNIQRLSVAGIYQTASEALRGRGAGARAAREISASQASHDEIGEQQRSIDQLVDAARDGQYILVVHLAHADQIDAVRATLFRHHAHMVRHFEQSAPSA